MALGCPQRPLSIKEPDESTLLPSDELSWEEEVINPLDSTPDFGF